MAFTISCIVDKVLTLYPDKSLKAASEFEFGKVTNVTLLTPRLFKAFEVSSGNPSLFAYKRGRCFIEAITAPFAAAIPSASLSGLYSLISAFIV